MASPIIEAQEIIDALAESELGWLGDVARAAIESLPDIGAGGRDGELRSANQQLNALSEAVLFPLKRELELVGELPAMASRLGLSPNVLLRMGETDRAEVIELTSEARRGALGELIGALGAEIGGARERAARRAGPQQ